MRYGFYTNIRDGAWKCLLDFEIDSLPVDVLKIARGAGVRVIKNSTVDHLLATENGKTYYDGKNWIIIYNDKNSVPLCRFTVAHELGHIFLGHELVYEKQVSSMEFTHSPKYEQQANMFALRLLCPTCLLWALELHTPEEIANRCQIPLSLAAVRASRMKLLIKRNRFLTSPLERQVFEQFRPYLEFQNQ